MAEDKIPKKDEFGTIRFTLYSSESSSAEFEHEEGSDAVFITFRDSKGHAVGKALLNINNPSNEALMEAYEGYLREAVEEDKYE